LFFSELSQTSVGTRLGADGQDFDLPTGHVVEHADIVDAEPILWAVQPSQSLDTTLARLFRLISQMRLHCMGFADQDDGALSGEETAAL